MNGTDRRYTRFTLVREMLETPAVMRAFDPGIASGVDHAIREAGRLLLTGEGSSRIFPARNAIRRALTSGSDLCIATEGSRQAATYDLSRWAVFCASNSGRTREVVLLAQKLRASGHRRCYGLSAASGTPLEQSCERTFVLGCGPEAAVAATKSVVEQALFHDALAGRLAGDGPGDVAAAADAFGSALAAPIDPAIVRAAAQAPTIYFAGYNDGVAEELTLKANEITRRRADYLEGTYAVHGIEEVMDSRDVVVVIDPIAEEADKFREVLVDGVGLTVVAIATSPTVFPTILVPEAGWGNPYVFVAAGWNLLVEIGLELGVDLDKPERARKIGNEFGTGLRGGSA